VVDEDFLCELGQPVDNHSAAMSLHYDADMKTEARSYIAARVAAFLAANATLPLCRRCCRQLVGARDAVWPTIGTPTADLGVHAAEDRTHGRSDGRICRPAWHCSPAFLPAGGVGRLATEPPNLWHLAAVVTSAPRERPGGSARAAKLSAPARSEIVGRRP
jgi:hypothetical protein